MRHRFEMPEFDRREAEEEFEALLAGLWGRKAGTNDAL
jgi:hypothetical protein